MQVQISRWGNSLGMRIPRELAKRFGLKEGARVEVRDDGDRIVISIPRPRYELATLVADLSHEELSVAFDWGDDMGREVID